MKKLLSLLTFSLLTGGAMVSAQWDPYPMKNVPRLPNGKVDVQALFATPTIAELTQALSAHSSDIVDVPPNLIPQFARQRHSSVYDIELRV